MGSYPHIQITHTDFLLLSLMNTQAYKENTYVHTIIFISILNRLFSSYLIRSIHKHANKDL